VELCKKKTFTEGEIESPGNADEGRQWIWIGYAPEFRLILSSVVGPRTYESALSLIQTIAAIVCGIPCFFSDGFSCYMQALIECYHQIKSFPLTGKRGRPKKPVKEAHPDLVYGQIVKQKKKGRLVDIVHRIRCGAKRFSESGLKISTSLLERVNLTFRQALAPLGRKSLSFSKKRENLRMQVVFFSAFYNFARPHMSLREEVVESKELFKTRWKQKTPAMAAGISDHVWSFREFLTIKPIKT
jgi:IS1 family transposase